MQPTLERGKLYSKQSFTTRRLQSFLCLYLTEILMRKLCYYYTLKSVREQNHNNGKIVVNVFSKAADIAANISRPAFAKNNLKQAADI